MMKLRAWAFNSQTEVLTVQYAFTLILPGEIQVGDFNNHTRDWVLQLSLVKHAHKQDMDSCMLEEPQKYCGSKSQNSRKLSSSSN
jgi:hypothetical protein